MKRTSTKIRCVPRWGIAGTNVRLIDLDVDEHAPEAGLREMLQHFFASRGIADAVYDVDVDAEGYFAIVNDEAYEDQWGTPLF